MKKVLLMALAILMCAQMAYGQAGYVGVFADKPGTVCSADPIPGVYSFFAYVVHTLGGPTAGVGFNIVGGGGWDATLEVAILSEPFVAAGTPMGGTGVVIDYGSCITTAPIPLCANNSETKIERQPEGGWRRSRWKI